MIEISDLSQPVFITIVWYFGTIAVLFAVVGLYTFEVMVKVIGRDEQEQRVRVAVPWFIPEVCEYFVCWGCQVWRPLKKLLDCCTETGRGALRLQVWRAWWWWWWRRTCKILQLTDTQLPCLQYRNQTVFFFAAFLRKLSGNNWAVNFICSWCAFGGHYS
jgi:hypothetical protein